MTNDKKKIIRQLNGTVVSDKMDKTIVVKVDRIKWHKKYGKQYRVSRKYKAHDPNNSYKIGDKVSIVADRPRSTDKRWRVIVDKENGEKE